MSQRHSNIGDEGAAAFHAEGELAPSSRRPAGEARGTVVIQFPFQGPVAAASMALEDASDPVDGFESIGSLAVRIVGQFKLPRISCRSAMEEDTADLLTS